jgi:TPR repeat protein
MLKTATSLRRLFAFFVVDECYEDVMPSSPVYPSRWIESLAWRKTASIRCFERQPNEETTSHRLALAFDYGNHEEQDYEKAAAWYAKAANQGHEAAESNILLQHILGQAQLLKAETVFGRLQTLAESEDRDAQNNLGLCAAIEDG